VFSVCVPFSSLTTCGTFLLFLPGEGFHLQYLRLVVVKFDS